MDLLIIGASARAAAQSAKRAGFTPHAIDLFGDEDLREVAGQVEVISFADYPQKLPEISKKFPPMPWMYVGGLEAHPKVIDEVSLWRPLLGLPAFLAEQLRDVDVLRPLAVAAALPLPKTGKSVGELHVRRERLDRWLIKSTKSSGGLRVRSATAIDTHLTDDEYVQEQVFGFSLSAAFVADCKVARLIGITRQLIGPDFGTPRPFQYAGNIGPITVEADLLAAVHEFGRLAVEELRMCGVFGVDIQQGRPDVHHRQATDSRSPLQNPAHVLEINPRYTSGMELFERSEVVHSVVALHAIGCTTELPREGDFLRPPKSVSGKLILYAPSAGQLPRDWRQRVECPPDVAWADVPMPQTTFRAGDPVVTVLCERATAEEVEHTLLAARDAFGRYWQRATHQGTSHVD